MSKSKVGCGGIGVIMYIVFMIIKGLIFSGEDSSKYIDDTSYEPEIITGTISHSLDWNDTEHPEKSYDGIVTLSAEDYYDSKKNKESYWMYNRDLEPDQNKIGPGSNAFRYVKEAFIWNKDVSSYSFDDSRWNSSLLEPTGIKEGYPYMKSYYNDNSKMNDVYSIFNKIQKQNNLSKYEFANMVVSFVQNIKYNIPTTGSCSEEYENGGMVQEMIDDGHSCDSYVAFGYYAPVEFIGNWKGDCDTRSVFLFTVLKHYGYDVVILNSKLYQHSILGINLVPESTTIPLYKKYNYTKYYAWEATRPLSLGLLNPEVNNMREWDVVLDNNLNCSITLLNL